LGLVFFFFFLCSASQLEHWEGKVNRGGGCRSQYEFLLESPNSRRPTVSKREEENACVVDESEIRAWGKEKERTLVSTVMLISTM